MTNIPYYRGPHRKQWEAVIRELEAEGYYDSRSLEECNIELFKRYSIAIRY